MYDDNVYFGKWVDSKGNGQIYFTGNNYQDHVCDCAFTLQGCSDSSHSCNCDSNDPVQQKDTGKITAMNHLPIMGFSYFGLKYDGEKAAFSFGPLKCAGAKTFKPGESCYDLKLQGETRSGYYQVWSGLSNGSGPRYQTVFCDFTQSISSSNLETDVSPVVMLEVMYDSVEEIMPGNLLTFNQVVIDTLPGYMVYDTGVYTVPMAGTYRIRLQVCSV